jgi:hypothetical protein
MVIESGFGIANSYEVEPIIEKKDNKKVKGNTKPAGVTMGSTPGFTPSPNSSAPLPIAGGYPSNSFGQPTGQSTGQSTGQLTGGQVTPASPSPGLSISVSKVPFESGRNPPVPGTPESRPEKGLLSTPRRRRYYIYVFIYINMYLYI